MDGVATGDTRRAGRDGEDIAAGHLERLGYRVIERNWRSRYGEIDLIATMDEFLVFVEVKTRTPGQPLHPALSVTKRKQQKVRLLGEYYRAQHARLGLQPRFDVIAVVLNRDGPQIEHIVNAF
jgi:putative endonuclease